MNKFNKVIIALFGACNKVFSVFTPIVLALVLINTTANLTDFNETTLLVIATMSSLFRAGSIWMD
tara:strand:+ start:183 stop:377 length:195 start_codon:yes stop_codon:yes gene_type:complete